MVINYNFGAIYELVGRVTQGTSVVAYMVRNRTDGSLVKIEKNIIEQLALNKQIYNCTAQVYGSIVNLKGINCKLNQLPKYDVNGTAISTSVKNNKAQDADLKLVGKVVNGRTISDYIVININEPDNKMRLPRDMVIKLTQNGRIINAKSQMNGKDYILRGTNGENLCKLKTYQA